MDVFWQSRPGVLPLPAPSAAAGAGAAGGRGLLAPAVLQALLRDVDPKVTVTRCD